MISINIYAGNTDISRNTIYRAVITNCDVANVKSTICKASRDAWVRIHYEQSKYYRNYNNIATVANRNSSTNTAADTASIGMQDAQYSYEYVLSGRCYGTLGGKYNQ